MTGPGGFDFEGGSWIDRDDTPFLGGDARESIEYLIDEYGLPEPETWDSFDIYMRGDEQSMTVSAEGYDYDFTVNGDIYNADDWDWMWDIWDWIAENYPDVDEDSHYE